MGERSTETGGEESGGPDPLSEWLARYDEAMRKGEPPPEPRPEAAGVGGLDLDRFRSFLDLLGRKLRPLEGPTGWDERPTVGDTPGEGAAPAGTAPRSIGRFRIEEELGRGGFGIVFRAFDPDMGRWVALKVPKADVLLSPDVRRRFLGEAHAAAQLDHPNLVPVFEAGEEGAVCYIASAYCEGPSLRAWIDVGGAPADPRLAARMVLALARAIEHMHARGLLHCDLKPGNVLLDLPAGGADPIPRVTDFGLARLADAPVGESTAARPWGTPPYMAPEQIEQRRDAIGPPTDVFALGGVLYELLTGRPPHEGESSWELMRAVVADPPTPPRRRRRSIPRDLDAIAMRCLEKRPERRYPTAAALADDLGRYLTRRPTKARPLGGPRRLARWAARNPTATAVLAMSLATLGLSVSYAIALRRTVAERDRHVDDLDRANTKLNQANDALLRANAEIEAALDAAQKQNYAATLIRTQQELSLGRWEQAQRRLRELIPAAGSTVPDPRDFAWHYLWRQARRDRTVFDDLAPSGACTLAAARGSLFGVTAGRHGGGAWRVDPPDAPTLGAARPRLVFEPWDVPASEIEHIAATADERLAVVLAGPANRDGILSIFDLSDGRVLFRAANPFLGPEGLAISTDGLRLAVGSRAAEADRLDRLPIELEGRNLTVLGVPEAGAIHFAADQNRIVSARRRDGGIHRRSLEIWDVATGRRVVARDDEAMGSALAVSPSQGGPIATGTLSGSVQLRDPRQGDLIATLPPPADNRDHRVGSLAFSTDGRFLAAGYSRRAVLWDVAGRRQAASIEGLTDWVDSIAFLPGWPGNVALGMGTGDVIVWHTQPMEDAVVPGGHDDEVWGVAYTADGRVATLGGDKRLKLWDGRTGAEGPSLGGHEAWPSCLTSAPAAGLLASADFGGRLLIWDAKEGRLLHSVQAHQGRIRASAFSPDGRLVATGGRDRVVRLWDAASGELAADLIGHEASVRGLAFSPDGRRLVSVGEDPAAIVWDVEARRILRRWESPVYNTCIAISPDGQTVGVGDLRGGVILRDLESGRLLTPLPSLQIGEISGLAFSPDGRVLAVAGQGGDVSLVEVGMGRPLVTLKGHRKGVNAVAFSPDGRTLASVSHDKTLRLWWAGPDEASAE